MLFPFHLLSASLSLLLSFSILSFTAVLTPPSFSMDSISFWFPPVFFHIARLRYPTLVQLAVLSHSPIQRYLAMAVSHFFGMLVTLYCHFNFLTSLTVLSGYSSSSALDTAVFLVVLEHPIIFFGCCRLYCFQLFYGLPPSLPVLLLHIPALVQ